MTQQVTPYLLYEDGESAINPVLVGRTSQIYVIVDDVDAHHARAKAEGISLGELLDEARAEER